jgi:hypothetical protein
MSELDLLRFLETFAEEAELADFSPEELKDLLDKLSAGDEPLPLTPEAFKKRYFEYYDDVKGKSLKKQDW